jgi:hypothetical protein
VEVRAGKGSVRWHAEFFARLPLFFLNHRAIAALRADSGTLYCHPGPRIYDNSGVGAATMARLKFTLASLAAFATSSSSLPAPVSDTSSLPLRVLTAAPEHRGVSPSFGEFSDTSTLTVYGGKAGNGTSLRHSNALFGIPSYGGSLTARVYYPQAPANATGCSDLTVDPNIPSSEPVVFLLDRGGGCRFSTKVLNAQRAGGVAALVADTNGLCGVSPECTASICSRCPLYSSVSTCSCVLPYMAGDPGSGDVSIPSFMVSRDDGANMKPFAGPGSPGQLFARLAWDIPNPGGAVEYAFWLASNDAFSNELRVGFEQTYLPYFASRALFTPRFYVWDGRTAGCGIIVDCATQCINGGYYCNIDPDGDLYKGISGADVVLENLRQMCVWKQANTTYAVDYGRKWWTYADLFSERCTSPATWSVACSEACMAASGLDVAAVRQCVVDSNSTVNPATGDYTNVLLEEALALRSEMAIIVLPTAVVNDVILRGGTTPATVATAVCGGFSPGTAPPVCSCLTVPVAQLQACVQAAAGGGGGGGSPDGSAAAADGELPPWAGGLIAVVVLGLVAAAAGSVYMRHKTRQDVEEMLDDYRALMEEGPAASAAVPGADDADRPRLVRTNGRGSALSRNAAVQGLITRLSGLLAVPPPGAAPAAKAQAAAAGTGAGAGELA